MPISLCCDLRFASDRALFTVAFSQRGLIAEWGVAWLLPRVVGPAHALDMLFSSRKVDAQEAERIGLVNRVVPHDELMAHTREYVEHLARTCSPASMRIMKRQVYQQLTRELGPSEREVFAFPPLDEQAILVDEFLEVERVRLWSVEETEYGPGIFAAHGWTIGSSDPALFAGLGYDRVGFRSAESASPLDLLATPYYGAYPFGTGQGSFRFTGHALESVTLEMFREIKTTQVGLEDYEFGAGFLYIPTTPP